MRWQGQPTGLKFENAGTPDTPLITLSIWSQNELDVEYLHSLLDEIIYRYNLRLDLTEFTQSVQDDAHLKPIVERWLGMRPMTAHSLYEYLIVAIILQNTVIRRSIKMMQTLFENYGTRLHFDGKELFCFWESERLEQVDEQALRDLKLGYRAKSIKRVSAPFARHEIDEFALRAQSKEEQRTTLLNLYGIGPASVWYLLFDIFHHMDELGHISPWEQKIYSKLFCDVEPADPVPVERLLDMFEERFGAYKMLAVHYVWEDVFWRRTQEDIPWLEALVRR
jgi:3-methyladenine DNA glycosylase/8-oxoguanine DNA glycosylase